LSFIVNLDNQLEMTLTAKQKFFALQF